jgi:hypothetical protein
MRKKERNRLENLDLDGRIILNRILNKTGRGCGLDSFVLE